MAMAGVLRVWRWHSWCQARPGRMWSGLIHLRPLQRFPRLRVANKTPGVAGGPPSGAVCAGGNNAYCPTCQDAGGMPRWWVDEPYINLHMVDEPLSYTTSSGQKMTFRFNYKQRFALPGLDQVPNMFDNNVGYNRITMTLMQPSCEAFVRPRLHPGMTNAAWSHNWMMNIVFWDGVMGGIIAWLCLSEFLRSTDVQSRRRHPLFQQ